MKKIFFIIFLSSVLTYTFGQKPKTINSFEFLFSWADVVKNGSQVPDNLRFTLWFNYGRYWNFDFNNFIGLQSGVAIRNVGMITKENYLLNDDYIFQPSKEGASDNIKTKRRTYNLGMPLLFKFGAFDKNIYFYAGGEYELLFHYKQKYLIEGRKIKETDWFSDRVNLFVPSIITGIKLPKGLNLRFKYYLDDFLNKNYSYTDINGNTIRPYQNMSTQLFYISAMYTFHDIFLWKEKANKDSLAGL